MKKVYKRHLKTGVIFYSRIEDSKIPKKRYYGGLYDALGDLFFTIDRFLELVFYQNSGPEYHQIFIIYRKTTLLKARRFNVCTIKKYSFRELLS